MDGFRFERGILEKGTHRIASQEGPARGRLVMETPTPVPPPNALPEILYVGFN